MAEAYAYQGAQMGGQNYVAGLNQTADVKRSTSMESMSAQMGQSYRRLRDMNDILQGRIDTFAPQPTQLAGNSATQPAPPVEPQPGTMASLNYIANNTGDELSRLDGLLCRLQEIL